MTRPVVRTSVEEERNHRKQSSPARCGSSAGWDSARVSPATSRCGIRSSPTISGSIRSASASATCGASDLILVNHAGEVVYGKHPVNRAAFVIHAAIHQARPDVVAAAHSHSLYGKSFSSLGIPLAPITQDACIFYEDHVVIDRAGRGGRVGRSRRARSSPPSSRAARRRSTRTTACSRSARRSTRRRSGSSRWSARARRN